MNPPRATTSDEPAAELDEPRRRVLLDLQLERLDRLAEIGMEMAEALLAQAKGEGPPVVDGDVVLAYGRASRAVRMAILLQAHLAEAPQSASAEPEPEPTDWLDLLRLRAQTRRQNVSDIVEYVAGRAHEPGDAVERLGREAAERLERDRIYRDLLNRPLSEIVADICRDLGLEPDWDDLAGQPWARRERASDKVGRPLAPAAAAAPTASPGSAGSGPGGEGAAAPARAFEPPD